MKIDVKSGDPYRDNKGHFGTSPAEKLRASLAALDGLKLVSHDDNKQKVDSAKSEAEAKLAALRSGNNGAPLFTAFDVSDPYKNLPDSYARTLDNEKMVGDLTLAQYYHDKKNQAGSIVTMSPDEYINSLVDYTAKNQPWKPSYSSPEAVAARTDMTKVDKYAQFIKDGGTFDEIPSLIFGEDGDIDGQEGLHRTYAAKKAGLSTIPVYVQYDPHNIPKDFYKKHGDNVIQGYDGRTDKPVGHTNSNNAPVLDPSTTETHDKRYDGRVINANITPDQQRQIDLAEAQFQQSVTRVDNQILALYVQAVQDGSYAAAEAILKNYLNSAQVNTLMFAMLTISLILLPLYARQRMDALRAIYGKNTTYVKTDAGEKTMREQAKKGAESHVHTIAKDIKNSLDDAIDGELSNEAVRAGMEQRFPELKGKDHKDYLNDVRSNEDIYKYARQLVLQGASRDTIIKKLQENFTDVSKRRAKVIAGNESNRVFTYSQFEADEQFLAQNKLTEKAYKRLISNTGHPCPICHSLIDKTKAHPIPFKQDFLPFGKEVKGTYTTPAGKQRTWKFTPNYEHLSSGHIHVNCHCRYELLIKKEDGTWLNTITGKTENELDWSEELHPRDGKGKFSKKAGNLVNLFKLGTVDEFNQFIEDNYWQGTFGNYSQEATDAVRAYQGHYYDAINMHARAAMEDKPLSVYGENTTYKKTIDNINNAANIELANDTLLYRGTEIPYHANNQVGEVIHSRSFLSTSAVKDVSDDFKTPGGSTLVITAKKGKKVILPDLVTFGKRGRTMGEAEVLIPTGSSLTITRIDGDVVYAQLN